ncbi:hypothetical protein IRZ83_01095 [Flavobacterium sp. JLP]|uniref:hypothetical protein n=1 Tax=unclassified Flavobacterium TaxID=196869 RepID=UPI00049342AC|nr:MULTISPECIES: hypothetical protein [unclassified Flavobacterium]MBF4505243.1 hypothetical protein [Flavobacterium sp. JLP]
MNPFNLLINYFIANSRATFYNVPGNQEITNTALLAGVVSENPLLSYLLIENKAKDEGDKFNASAAASPQTRPGLPAPSSGPIINTPNPAETPTGSPVKGTATADFVTLEAVKNEISISTQNLKDELFKISEKNKAEITKNFTDSLNSKIELLTKSNDALSISILEIKQRLNEISTNPLGPDNTLPVKGLANQKASTKNEPK